MRYHMLQMLEPKSNQIGNDSTNDLGFSKSQKRNHNKNSCPVISEVHLSIMMVLRKYLKIDSTRSNNAEI